MDPLSTWHTDKLVCPYCGYVEDDSWELWDCDDDYVCPECGETFSYERCYEVTYTSIKKAEGGK